jgi:hypothetical protein
MYNKFLTMGVHEKTSLNIFHINHNLHKVHIYISLHKSEMHCKYRILHCEI